MEQEFDENGMPYDYIYGGKGQVVRPAQEYNDVGMTPEQVAQTSAGRVVADISDTPRRNEYTDMTGVKNSSDPESADHLNKIEF